MSQQTRTGPDPTGLAVARAAQEVARPNTIILFGSRARGDHRPDSDVDLLVIQQGGNITPDSRIKRAVRAYFAEHPPELGVDLVSMDRERFDYCRRAKNHVSAQAIRDGVIMSGERMELSDRCQDNYPDCWPDVKERLQAAHRHLGTFCRLIEHPDSEQEIYGFHAQQAVENGMKAWMSAADIGYQRIRDLRETAESILTDPDESNTPAAARLRALMDYTTSQVPNKLGEYENWLTKYALAYRHMGTGFRIDNLQRDKFRVEITAATNAFIDRAHELCGTDDSDLR